MRSPLHGFFVACCCCLTICDLPATRALQTYKQSTVGAELTPAEYVNFVNNHVLPARFQYSPKLNAIVEVKNPGQDNYGAAAAAGDDGDHEGKVLMPRWQSWLRRMRPNVPGFGSLPSFESLSGLGSFLSPSAAAAGEPGEDGADEAGTGGISSRVMSGLGSMRDSLNDYWKSTAAAPSEEAAAGDAAGPGLMASTYGMAKDAAASPIGQEAIKFALGFLPGGGSAVRAYETGTKIAEMAKSTEDLKDNIPKI